MNNKIRRVPPETRVYAVGDVHGSFEQLKKINDLILDYETKKGALARSVIIYLGDYIDRGPKSKEVIEYLINHKTQGFEHIYLMGNHEYAILEFLRRPEFLRTWINWGGDDTLKSYGVDISTLEKIIPEEIREKFFELIPEYHLKFFNSLQKYHVEGDFIFVHAGLKPGLELEKQDELVMMMIRNDFFDSDYDFGKNIVFGHTIFDKPFIKNGRIGIDTGAFISGRLTCAVIEKDKVNFLST